MPGFLFEFYRGKSDLNRKELCKDGYVYAING